MLFSDAIDEFLRVRAGIGFSKATVRGDGIGLRKLLAHTGNIRVAALDARHVETWVADLRLSGYKPATINTYVRPVSVFCEWARQRKYLPLNVNPLGTIRWQPIPEVARRRLDVSEFGAVLDAAPQPRVRMLVALGLYLFLRASEAQGLRLGDIDLGRGEVTVWQPKTKRQDVMPICTELDVELRRWLTVYTADQPRPLTTKDFLLPGRMSGRFQRVGDDIVHVFGDVQYMPGHRMSRIPEHVHSALRGIGWDVSAGDREGMHTLRRSGARALFDELCRREEGRDGALRYVSAMLHHRSVTVTEKYLGLEVDREKRDALLKSRPMFTSGTVENVVELREGLA